MSHLSPGKPRLVAWLWLQILFVLFIAYPVQAAILRVDDDAAGPVHDGSAWSTAFLNLQDALAAAASGDEIWVASGVYYPDQGGGQTEDDRNASFVLIEGVAIYGGFTGTESKLDQRDVTTNPSILSGDIDGNDVNTDGNSIAETPDDVVGSNSFRIISAFSTASTSRLDGFTITGGLANDPAVSSNTNGGAIHCRDGSPTIANCKFHGNSAINRGGAIWTFVADLVLEDCELKGNSAVRGGALSVNTGSPTLLRCRFEENHTTFGGGAISFINGTTDSSARIQSCQFIRNSTDREGGALALEDGHQVELLLCTFLGNSADEDGGAVWNIDAATRFESCLFSGNLSGDDGGVLYNRKSSTAPERTIELINCTLSGNSCTDAGGAIYNSSSSQSLSMINSILWNNAGGAAHPLSEESLNNSSATFQPIFTNSLVEHLDLTGTGSGNLDGTDPSNDPAFVLSPDPLAAPE